MGKTMIANRKEETIVDDFNLFCLCDFYQLFFSYFSFVKICMYMYTSVIYMCIYIPYIYMYICHTHFHKGNKWREQQKEIRKRENIEDDSNVLYLFDLILLSSTPISIVKISMYTYIHMFASCVHMNYK
jgi:hypothetical protein